MTGSDMGGVLVGMTAISFLFLGIVLLIVGGIIALFSFQLWIFIIGGIFILLGAISYGWLVLGERRRTPYASKGLNLR